MGIFSRSNSSASSHRSSRLLQAPDTPAISSRQSRLHLDINQTFSNNIAGQVPSSNVPCGQHSNVVDKSIPLVASTHPSSWNDETKRKADLVSPSIPLRTSSKDATGMNSLARSLMSRGRKLKSSASKLSLVSNISTASKGADIGKTACQNSNKSNSRDSSNPNISHPSHFRHLTHALPHQFAKMANATQSELVADFSVMRASQNTRRDFRGIKTVDLHSRTSSVETNSASFTSTETSSSLSSTTLSLASESTRNSTQNLDQSSPMNYPDIYSQRSHDSFSQPFSRRPLSKTSIAAPFLPPPRKSSRKASTLYGLGTAVDQDRRKSVSDSTSHRIDQIGPGAGSDYGTHSEPLDVVAQPLQLGNPDVGFSEETLQPAEDWQSSSYGRSLSCVDEEDVAFQLPSACTHSASISNVRKPRPRAPSQSETYSCSSSSQNTTATISRCRCDSLFNKGDKAAAPTSAVLSNAEPKRSMQRSSLNNGLFTSWSFDEEPLYSRSFKRGNIGK